LRASRGAHSRASHAGAPRAALASARGPWPCSLASDPLAGPLFQARRLNQRLAEWQQCSRVDHVQVTSRYDPTDESFVTGEIRTVPPKDSFRSLGERKSVWFGCDLGKKGAKCVRLSLASSEGVGGITTRRCHRVRVLHGCRTRSWRCAWFSAVE